MQGKTRYLVSQNAGAAFGGDWMDFFSWKTKLETEEYSKFLGYWNPNLLYEREFYKSLRGPGNNDINEDYYKKVDFSIIPNTGFGTAKRFRDEKCSDAPNPSIPTFYTRIVVLSFSFLNFSHLSTSWENFHVELSSVFKRDAFWMGRISGPIQKQRSSVSITAN